MFTFCFCVDNFSPYDTHIAGGVAMTFVDDLFLPLMPEGVIVSHIICYLIFYWELVEAPTEVD